MPPPHYSSPRWTLWDPYLELVHPLLEAVLGLGLLPHQDDVPRGVVDGDVWQVEPPAHQLLQLVHPRRAQEHKGAGLRQVDHLAFQLHHLGQHHHHMDREGGKKGWGFIRISLFKRLLVGFFTCINSFQLPIYEVVVIHLEKRRPSANLCCVEQPVGRFIFYLNQASSAGKKEGSDVEKGIMVLMSVLSYLINLYVYLWLCLTWVTSPGLWMYQLEQTLVHSPATGASNEEMQGFRDFHKELNVKNINLF